MTIGDFLRFLGALGQVTAAQARLTPANAAMEIDRLILTAQHRGNMPLQPGR